MVESLDAAPLAEVEPDLGSAVGEIRAAGTAKTYSAERHSNSMKVLRRYIAPVRPNEVLHSGAKGFRLRHSIRPAGGPVHRCSNAGFDQIASDATLADQVQRLGSPRVDKGIRYAALRIEGDTALVVAVAHKAVTLLGTRI